MSLVVNQKGNTATEIGSSHASPCNHSHGEQSLRHEVGASVPCRMTCLRLHPLI